jgi:hypothetical protein
LKDDHLNFDLDQPVTVWCRLKGPNGKRRELKALLNFNYSYCMLLRQDAIDIGYPETSYQHGGWRELRPDRAPIILTFRGVERTILINLKEVAVGRLVAKDVDAVVLEYDLPPMAPVEMVLGWTFLKNFNLNLDPHSHSLSLT